MNTACELGIRYGDVFEDPDLPGTIAVTIELAPVFCGTEVRITQSGLPAVIPLELCYLGWKKSLAQQAALVERDIAD